MNMYPIYLTLDSDGELCEVVALTKKWCKPIFEIGGSFDSYIKDPNMGIVNALWRRNSAIEESANKGYFPAKELDDFEQKRLNKFVSNYQ